jgi:hypothetical protein
LTSLPQVSGLRLIRALKRDKRFEVEEGAKHALIYFGGRLASTIPRHRTPLKPGTLKGILGDLGLRIEDLKGLL